jgi:hypothetical protein
MSFQKPEKDFGEGPVRASLHPLRQPQITSPQWRGTSLSLSLSLSQKIFNGLNTSHRSEQR